MIKNKLKLYYKASIQIFFKYIYGKVLISNTRAKLIKKEKINVSSFKTYNGKNYYFYKIKNARIYTDNNENVAVIKNNFILPFVSFQQANGNLKKIRYNSVLKIGTPSFVRKIKGKVFNLCQGDSGNNFFHFLFDIVPKIYLLTLKIDLKKINYFYVSDPKKWQIKIFKILGIGEEKLLSSKRNNHIFVEEIYAVDHPWYNKGYIQENVKKIPKWIIQKNREFFLDNSKQKFKNKIFLDRSKSKYNHCQINNLNDIKNLVLRKNFRLCKPEYLSFKKQINLFKSSSIIIGAHGAAFSNIIFCKSGTKIIEIIPADHPNKKCERISKILKLKYFRIETVPDNSDKNYPFKINLSDKNFKLIEKIINL
ncbi:MAG: glycosyltransferase family 61 protein [Candidatus Pelagibacter sp.]